MNKVCLFGASGHGKVLHEIATSIDTKVIAFFDDNPREDFLHKIPVLLYSELEKYKELDIVISIGNNKIRKQLSDRISNPFTKLIHRTAVISESCKISEGSVVMAGGIVNADVTIGKHVIINSSAIVEHDSRIEDYVHISPNATITGGVEIGEGTHVGSGAIIIPEIKVGRWCTIGAGTIVTKNIPDFSTVVGNPGRIIENKR